MSDMKTEQTKRKAAAQPTPPTARAKQKTEPSTGFTDGEKEIARYLDAGKNIDPVSLPQVDEIILRVLWMPPPALVKRNKRLLFSPAATKLYTCCALRNKNTAKAMQHAVPEIKKLITVFNVTQRNSKIARSRWLLYAVVWQNWKL